MPKNAINPTDKHVGSRLRMRRLMLDMSQTDIANALGLTFQRFRNTRRDPTGSAQAGCNTSPKSFRYRFRFSSRARRQRPASRKRLRGRLMLPLPSRDRQARALLQGLRVEDAQQPDPPAPGRGEGRMDTRRSQPQLRGHLTAQVALDPTDTRIHCPRRHVGSKAD